MVVVSELGGYQGNFSFRRLSLILGHQTPLSTNTNLDSQKEPRRAILTFEDDSCLPGVFPKSSLKDSVGRSIGPGCKHGAFKRQQCTSSFCFLSSGSCEDLEAEVTCKPGGCGRLSGHCIAGAARRQPACLQVAQRLFENPHLPLLFRHFFRNSTISPQ